MVDIIRGHLLALRGRLKRPAVFAAAFDVLFAALVALAIVAELAGEFEPGVAGLRISMKATWRIAAWAAVVAAVRHLLVPRPSLLDRLWDSGTADAERRQLERVRVQSLYARIGLGALLAAVFAAAAAVVLFPQIRHPFAVPDLGDPLFSIWRLAWIAHQLPRDPSHLFDANIFHPHPRTLAYSDAMLLPGLAGSPLLWLGVHQVLVYNLVFLAAIVFSGVTMFFLVRALTGARGAALVSGLLFAFCSFRFSHYSHLELQVALWIPLALYWLHRTLVTARIRYGVLTGIALGLQASSSLYYGIFCATFMIVVALALWMAGHFTVRRTMPALLTAAIGATAIIGPYSLPYYRNRETVGERGRHEIDAFSARPSDYLAAHPRSVHHGWIGGSENGERELFPGLVPLSLAAIALWPPLSPVRLAYAAGVAVAFDASLGFNGEIYHWLHAYAPPFRGLRAPARFGMIVTFGLSVLAGYGFARLSGIVRRWALRVTLAVAVSILALVEARPNLTLEPVWLAPPSVYRAIPAGSNAVLAEFPFPETEAGVAEECRIMYLSTFHWHRLVNGNSGFFPDDYHRLRRLMQRFPSDEAMARLRDYGVEYVVIHQKFYDPAAYDGVIAQLQRRPDVRQIAVARWEGSETRLYQIADRPIR